MARIQGKFVDETTGKGLSGVNMDVFIGPDMSGTPAGSFQSDTDGSFNVDSSLFDNGQSTVNVEYPGYYQMTGDPELFNGTIALTPNQVTSVINKVPVWAWVLVALVALFVGHQYFYKGKKII